MLKINKKYSKKGFSLIELMIAVVILAMVVLGIFLAFGTGFRGMADARDRTEAVNYIQKAFEEYKNTPFVKIIDQPMKPIDGTKFSSGSIVIEQETRLKKVITQVRWPDRNGDIKIEEASTLIYATEKTGELLSASDIILYARPYFRLLPNKITDLYAEIHDANGNIVTNKSYTVNFLILPPDPEEEEEEVVVLGELSSPSANTINGVANITFHSFDNEGSVKIQASADLDGVDVSDTIELIISLGAEGIILVPSTEFSLPGTSVSVNVELYVVDASFEINGVVEEYTGTITLSAAGPGTLSVNSIDLDPSDGGTANFTIYSNGSSGTVEIIASAPDLDLGYTEVTFTGGAKSIRLTPINGSIYEGESIEITITIWDENNNPTPFTGYITMASDGGGSFTPSDSIEFSSESSKTVDFFQNVAAEGIEVTASGEGLTSNSIYIDVLDSLFPSYIELSAIPSNVKANGSVNDYAVITATVYDADHNIVTNYSDDIIFSIDGETGVGHFVDNNSIEPTNGIAQINLYSNNAGIATVTATSVPLTEGSTDITFYSDASYILLTTNSGSVEANGEDYAVITATVYDADDNIVTNYLYDITFSVSGVGYFDDVNPVAPINGIAQVNLYSNDDGTATVDASSNDLSQPLLLEADTIYVDFTLPQDPEIQLLKETVSAYSRMKIVQFEVEVTNANLLLDIIEISWSDNAAKLNKIEIASPTSEMDYEVIFTGNASYPGTTVSTISKTLLMGNSIFKLTFDNNMRSESINITLTDEGGLEYTLDEINI